MADSKSKHVKPAEAALIIGCSVSQVRRLAQQGILRAFKEDTDCRPFYRYWISVDSAIDYANTKQGPGYPRGRRWDPDRRVASQTKGAK